MSVGITIACEPGIRRQLAPDLLNWAYAQASDGTGRSTLEYIQRVNTAHAAGSVAAAEALLAERLAAEQLMAGALSVAEAVRPPAA